MWLQLRHYVTLRILAFGFLVIWGCMHIPGLLYGTGHIPLNVGYVGDEQVSVTSVLHVIQDKSLLAFRNHEMQYYGPLFVIIDFPGVVADYVWKFVTGVVHSPEEYKRFLIWDWGGVVLWIRLTAFLAMLLGLVATYFLAATKTLNPSSSRYVPYFVTFLMACNYYYFEYSHFSTHWAYVIPLLIVQLYALVRIEETAGEVKKYWFIHALASIVSFGVSYFGMIFLAMWFPILYRMVRNKEWVYFKKFLLCMFGIVIGYALLVWWHPFAFLRYLSFLGIGKPLHHLGDAQNPFAFHQTSLAYYSILLIINNLGLVLVTILLAIRLFLRRVGRLSLMWVILLPGVVNFFMFGLAEHHEGRYMLPTIVSLILLCGYFLSTYIIERHVQTRMVTIVVAVLLAWYLLFNIVNIFQWIRIFNQGPLEQEAIQTALQLQKDAGPVLIINSYIFGYPQTVATYKAFQEKRGYDDSDLYKAMFLYPPKEGLPLLDARYAFLTEYENDPHLLRSYPHAILLNRPRAEDLNQFSYFDEDVMRNWYYRESSPSYSIVK